jgi:hypothetical protein
MEQLKAITTQIYLTMLAHCFSLPNVLILAYPSYDSKAFFKKVLLKAAKIAPSTVSRS